MHVHLHCFELIVHYLVAKGFYLRDTIGQVQGDRSGQFKHKKGRISGLDMVGLNVSLPTFYISVCVCVYACISRSAVCIDNFKCVLTLSVLQYFL